MLRHVYELAVTRKMFVLILSGFEAVEVGYWRVKD